MLISQLFEMAAPRESQRSAVYFHGTSKESAARNILTNGLDPAATAIKYGDKNPVLRPEHGKVYITPQLSYAMIYALGGNMFGIKNIEDTIERKISEDGEYGYVFEIKGKLLQDIGVDEDSIGELLYQVFNKQIPITPALSELSRLAYQRCTERQIMLVKEGDYLVWAQVGKKLNKILSDQLKLDLIDTGLVHLTHTGKLPVSRCWRFNKRDAPKIKPDGSNFKRYARIWRG